MRPFALLSLILSLVLATPALAHGPDKGPRGGKLTDSGAYHLELLVQGKQASVYVYDSQNRPVKLGGATGSLLILVNGKQETLALTPKEEALNGTMNLEPGKSLKAVVTVNLPGEKPLQARLTLD